MKNTLEQTFEIAEWEDVGEWGFKPSGSGDSWDPLTFAPGLAHDFMEHAGRFSMRGEVMAHAAMYFIRYETGYYPRVDRFFRPIELDSFSTEWIQLYRGMVEHGATLGACKPQERLDDSQEMDLAEILSRGKRAILSEFEKEDLDTDAYAMLCKHYAEWFRRGYHEAAARYSVIGSHGAADAFDRVLNYFHVALKGELEELAGNKVTISLDLDTGEVSFEEIGQCWSCAHECPAEDRQCENCLDNDE